MPTNLKYQWCEPNAKSDKEFLGWIYQRLHTVFAEPMKMRHMERLDKIIIAMDGVIPSKMSKKLENDPVLAEAREKFRQALSDLNHPEATYYSHWALEAFDKAYGLIDEY